MLHYHASVTQKVDAGGVDDKYGYCEDCSPSVFDAGTLTLDVVDARTNKLVWRAWAESTFDGVVDNQQWLERRIDEGVARIRPPLALTQTTVLTSDMPHIAASLEPVSRRSSNES